MKKLLFLLLFSATVVCNAQLSADIEASWIFSIPYNVVRIPSSGGTEIDLVHDLDPEQKFAFRGRINYTLGKRHVISALAAPLTIRSNGTLPYDVRYDDQTFQAGTPLKAVYTFNSYRLTYRYLFINGEKLQACAGLTGKLRQANIKISSGGQSADFPDVGLVPLINFYLNWSFTPKAFILLEGDALISGRGRAEDIFIGAGYRLGKRMALKAGYRLLEGGADTDRNYNFSFFNYAAAGVLFNY